MSLIPLPFRLAGPSQTREPDPTTTPESLSTPVDHVHPGQALHRPSTPSPLIAENGDVSSVVASLSPELRIEAAAGPSSHQFWLKDAKIAEDLFTIHRSAKHLVDFTSSMIGTHDTSLGHRPIPVMSDGDVIFMTQLSSDISRGVSGITAVRGMRTKKRKAAAARQQQRQRQRDHAGGEPPAYFTTIAPTSPTGREVHSYRHSKGGSRDERTSSKRLHISKDHDEPCCQRCGRKETPEWRKGPEGLLCNVCGLIAKRKRKMKGG